MEIVVARHGETQWNREGRYQGRRESELTELGYWQAAALEAALASQPFARVIASPLERCVGTARPLAAGRGLTPEIEPLLIEIGHGVWEGRTRDEIERDDAATMRAWREAPHTVRFPGGESLDDVLRRWRQFVQGHAGPGNAVVVTHDVLVRLAILEGSGRSLERFWEPRVQNGGYARFKVESGRWALIEECCEAHLRGIATDPSRQAL